MPSTVTWPADGPSVRTVTLEIVDMAGAPRTRLGTLLSRAFRRQCPHCGGPGIFSGFWKLAPHCPTCGHRFEREPGYWVGAVIFNTILATVAFLGSFGGFLLITWPAVPWNLVTLFVIGVTAVVPIAAYPWSQTLWMAYDLYVHPLEQEEINSARDRLGNSRPTTQAS